MKEKLIALRIEGFGDIVAPSNIPTGGVTKFGHITNVFLGLFVLTGVLLAVFFIIWGGIKYSTSAGDKNKVDAARKMIIYSIVGIIIIAFSFFILRIIGQMLNSPFLKSFGGI